MTPIEQSAFDDTQALLVLNTTFEHLHEQLANKILDLLNNDFNALVNLLYKIDVNEQKARTCFGKTNEEIAQCLAQLIWERQVQKAEYRKKYS